MKALKRADLINGSLVFVLGVQSATLLFCVAHRALSLPLATSRGLLDVEIPWLFIGLMIVVTAIVAVLVSRQVARTSGAAATAEHVVSATLWFVGYSVLALLLSIYYLNTFTLVFRP